MSSSSSAKLFLLILLIFNSTRVLAISCKDLFVIDGEAHPSLSSTQLQKLQRLQTELDSIENNIRWIKERYWTIRGVPRAVGFFEFLKADYRKEQRLLTEHFKQAKALHEQTIAELTILLPDMKSWMSEEALYRSDLRWQKILDQFEVIVPELQKSISLNEFREISQFKRLIARATSYQKTVEQILRGKHPKQGIQNIEGLRQPFFNIISEVLWAYSKVSMELSKVDTPEAQALLKQIKKNTEIIFLELAVQNFSLLANNDSPSPYLSRWYFLHWQFVMKTLPHSPAIEHSVALMRESLFFEKDLEEPTIEEASAIFNLVNFKNSVTAERDSQQLALGEQKVWSHLSKLGDLIQKFDLSLSETRRRTVADRIIDLMISAELNELSHLPAKDRLSHQARLEAAAHALLTLKGHWTLEYTWIISQAFRESSDGLTLIEPRDILVEPVYRRPIDAQTLGVRYNFKKLEDIMTTVRELGVAGSSQQIISGYQSLITIVRDVVSSNQLRDLVINMQPKTLEIIDLRVGIFSSTSQVNQQPYVVLDHKTRESLYLLSVATEYFKVLFEKLALPEWGVLSPWHDNKALFGEYIYLSKQSEYYNRMINNLLYAKDK